MTRVWVRWLSFGAVLLLVVGTLVILSTPAGPAAAQVVAPEPFPFSDRYPAEVLLNSEDDVAVLLKTGIDVGDVRPADGSWTEVPGAPFEPLIATIYVNDKEVKRLAAEGLAAQPIPNESLRAQALYGPGTTGPEAWPTYEQFVIRMQGLETGHPDIVRMMSIGQSVQGRELWVLKITDNPDMEEDEPEFKYSSTHHGDETVGIEMTLRLAELLVNGYGTDPEMTELVDEMEIWLWPVYNPDGYVASTRYNAHGEDLNRNFPDRIDDPVDDPAGREPETQAAMNWGYAHRFVMGANYHGGAAVVNYPWDSVGPGFSYYAPDDSLFYEYSVGYSSRNTRIWNGGFPNGVTRGWEWYIVYGGMQDWAYHWRGEHHVTIELGDTKKPPYEQMDTYWGENQDAMVWWMQRALRGARGLVTDANSGAPLDAMVDVVEIGKPVFTDPDVGDYHRLLLPGTYTLVASAPCYLPLTATVTVTSGMATVQDFGLYPADAWTVQGTVTEQATGRPLAAAVEFEGTGIVTHTNPATGHYEATVCAGTYTMTVTAAGHRPASRVVEVNGDQVQDFVLEPAPCTLLVDDDQGDNYQSWYQSALAAAGQAYDVWTVAGGDSPTAADLASYGRVVWLTGDDSSSTLTSSDQAALTTYLGGGGRLFLSGQDIGYDIGTTDFYANYLHATYLSDDTNRYTLTGADYLAGADVTIQGGDGANNQAYPSDIVPANGGTAVYHYPSPYHSAGVAYQDGIYGVTYFAFGFEAIDNAVDRTEVMSRTLAWLGGCGMEEYAVAAADSHIVGAPGETVTHTFPITNLGTTEDSYTIALTPGNWLATLLDLAVGPLQPMEAGQVRVAVQIPAQPAGRAVIATDTLTIEAASVAAPGVTAGAEGVTLAATDLAVVMAADATDDTALAGQTVTYMLTVTNSGAYSDTYTLSWGGNVWPVEVSPAQTPELAPGGAAHVAVRVQVPANPVAEMDTVTVRTTSSWDAAVYAEQSLVTRAVTGLAVVMAVDATAGSALAGQTVTYTLTVTNSGAYSDTYTLSWGGNVWPVEGSPAQTPELAPGSAAQVVVRVHVPANPAADMDTVMVRATSSWDAAVYAEQRLVTRRLWGVYLPLIVR
ncbi:MAG: carboxypeptidase-like regulatory domain-containing protein [Anaerolineae bacterium]|nr:carboxypeptidase-like regulatory domain-containing protein [Anaerolineae bacterium]